MSTLPRISLLTSPVSIPTPIRALALAVVLAMAIPAGAQDAAARQFTLDEVMSAPLPDGLVAARDRDVIAWVSNAQGSRNVWVAHGPDWEGRPITEWSGDDGQEVGELELAPDAGWILYTRGGAPNRDGWTPAPALPVEGAERTRWLHFMEGPRAGERIEIEQWGPGGPSSASSPIPGRGAGSQR